MVKVSCSLRISAYFDFLFIASIVSHRIWTWTSWLYNWISIALELRNGLNWVYDLNRQELCYFMCFSFTVLLLCIVFLAWNCYSSALFVRNQQSDRQGIVQFIQVRNEDLSLHRAILIMPGEIQEKSIGIKREKGNRKTVVTEMRHNLERLSASGKDSESIQNEIDTLWGVLEACLAVMDELQSMYLRLGDKDNMKSITEQAESFGKEINDVIEKAEGVVKDILRMQHKRDCCKSPWQSRLFSQRIRPPSATRQAHLTQVTVSDSSILYKFQCLVVKKLNSRISGRCF